MKVDFHFHLEEGPYSLSWLSRTIQALHYTNQEAISDEKHSLSWINKLMEQLSLRMKAGSFSKEWLLRYLIHGRAKGIEKFGVVDHLYRFREFKPYYEKHLILDESPLGLLQRKWLDLVSIGSIDEFLEVVQETAKEEDGLSYGVEADYFIGGEEELQQLLSPYSLDYVIGSVHFLDGWGFDNPETKERFEHIDLLELYEQLFETVGMAAKSGLFDIIAHLDNLKVYNYRPAEALLLPFYKEVAATLKKADVATEINTGLVYRYPVKEMCPSPSLLQILHQYGVPITLSSDAHFPDDSGQLIDQAIALAKQSGYQEIIYIKNRKRFISKL